MEIPTIDLVASLVRSGVPVLVYRYMVKCTKILILMLWQMGRETEREEESLMFCCTQQWGSGFGHPFDREPNACSEAGKTNGAEDDGSLQGLVRGETGNECTPIQF